MTDAGDVRFVLLEPQFPGNIGSVARVLKNLGFRGPVIVRPGCDPTGPEARRLAVDAAADLERAPVFQDLDEALDGAGIVIGTSRRIGKQRRPHHRLDRLVREVLPPPGATPTAVLFGREDHGLPDDALDRCTHLAHLPAGEAYPSFNLAQAVAIVAYEFALARSGPEAGQDAEPIADHTQREAMYAHLETALCTIGFLHADSVVPIMRRLRRLLGRADLGPDDVAILRGIARQILWSAERAGLARKSRQDLARGDED